MFLLDDVPLKTPQASCCLFWGVLVLASLVSVALWDRSPGLYLRKGLAVKMLCWCHLDVPSDAVLWCVLVVWWDKAPRRLELQPHVEGLLPPSLLYPKPPQKYSPFLLLSSNGCCLSLGTWRSQAAQGLRGHRCQVPGVLTCWVNLSPTSAQIPARRAVPLGIQQPWEGRLGLLGPSLHV